MRGRPDLALAAVVFATTTATDPAPVVEHHGGALVKVSEGRSLSWYRSVSAAVAAGRALAADGAGVGVAVGDVAMADGDLHGLSVVVAARLSGEATPGQVLVTATAARLEDVAGVPRGPMALRGIDAPVEVVDASA